MFADLTALIASLNAMSPLAIIALLAFIINHLVRGHRVMTAQVDKLRLNDLHNLPEMMETLRRIEAALTAGFATIIAKQDK